MSEIPTSTSDIFSLEAAIRDRLAALSEQLGGEYHKLYASFIGMSDEAKANPLYKTLGEQVSMVAALVNTLAHAVDSMPEPGPISPDHPLVPTFPGEAVPLAPIFPGEAPVFVAPTVGEIPTLPQ